MRYLVLAASALVATVFTGAVFTQLEIFGLQLDLILAAMVVMILLERTLTPMFYMAGGAIMLDMMFGSAFGFYTIPYLIVGVVVYLFAYKVGESKFYLAPIVGGVAWFIKDLASAVISIMIGNKFDFNQLFLSNTLLGIPFAAILTLLLYFLYDRIYRNSFMRPVPVYRDI